MKVYIVYSCYSEAYDDPSIEFEACATIQKAKEVFNNYKEKAIEQAKNNFVLLNDEFDEENFNAEFDIDEGDRIFECRETNGDKAWEAYIVEQDLLV